MSASETFGLDLRGLKCPLPVLRTRKKIKSLLGGSLLEVRTTDPLAVIDIPHFCSQDGHVLVESGPDENGHRFLIRKA